jgi:hypothetical protein
MVELSRGGEGVKSGGAEVGHESIPTYDKKVCGESRKSLGG